MKPNINRLTKHYEKLGVDERAKLMIEARMRDDSSELKKLISSAEVKSFAIRADAESNICEAWENIHKTLIMLCLPIKNRELACLASSICCLRNKDWDKLEEVESVAYQLQRQRQCYLQAFLDWMKSHDFPIDGEWLRAFEISVSEIQNSQADEVKELSDYREGIDVFSSIWLKACGYKGPVCDRLQ